MRKVLSILLLCMTCVFAYANKTYTFQLTDNWDAFSSTYGDATAWSNSYATHTLTLDGATLELTRFSKQTSTITDCPVCKGQNVTFTLSNASANILSAEIQCKQWNTKAQTVTLNSSTDGSTFTATDTKSYDFEPLTGTFESTDGIKAVRWTFNSSSNQVGVKYVTVVTDESDAAPAVAAPTFDPAAGSYYGPQTVAIACATEGATIQYSTDGETFAAYSAPVTVSATGSLWAKAVLGGTTYSDWLGDGAQGGALTNKYKVETVEGVSYTNVQHPDWGTADGIYVSVPVAIASCTVDGDIQGAGILLHLTAFTAKETSVTITDANGTTYTFKVYYADGTGDEPTTEESSVAKADYTINPVYASLADLVAAGEPTADGQMVQVTLTNEKLTGFYSNSSGVHTGAYVKVGDQEIELYKYSVPTDWETGGTVSGTVTGKWYLYNGIWEIALDSWDALTYTAPVLPFTATDKNGKEIKAKFAASPLTVKYNEDTTGLTFKVNGTETTYSDGLSITVKSGTKTNDEYNVQVYNGEELVAEQTYTWIPTATSVSTLKGYAEGTEAILSMSNARVTYATSDGKSAYIQDATRGIYAYNMGLGFTAYKQASVSIWGKTSVYNNVAEFVTCDSTSVSTVTASETDVTPTSKTIAQAKQETNQLTYIKISGAQIVKDGSNYYAVSAADSVLFYDSFKTGLLTALETVPCFADVTCITSMDKNGVYEILPIALDNVSDKITGVSGGVSWSIDMDGNMLFYPTDGVSGTFDATGVAASKRSWSSSAAAIKTVKFNEGVNANATMDYMFYQMANLESVDFTNFNTEACTSMKAFMQSCTNIKAIDLTPLNLSAVKTFSAAFAATPALETITFGENTCAAATDFGSLFYGTSGIDRNLKTVDMHAVTGGTVAKVNNMFYGCTALQTVDLRSFVTTEATSSISAVFGTANASYNYAALPDTIYLSKNFGTGTAYGDATKIAMPAKHYMALDHEGNIVSGKDFDFTITDITAADSIKNAFYEYNSALEDYGTYVTYVPLTATFDPADGTSLESFAKGDLITMTLNYPDQVGYVLWTFVDNNPDDPNAAVLRTGYMKQNEDLSRYAKFYSEQKLMEGHTYTFTAYCYATEADSQGDTSYANAFATFTATYTGTTKPYEYSTATLVTVSPEEGTELKTVSDNVITLTFSEAIQTLTANKNGGMGGENTECTCTSEDGITWTITIPEETLTATSGSLNLNVYAKDSLGRAVKGDNGEDEGSYFILNYVTYLGSPEFTVTPADGSTLESIDKIRVSYEGGINQSWLTSEKIKVYNEAGEVVYTVDTDNDITYDWDDITYEDVNIATPITTPGTYTVVFPSIFFALGEEYSGYSSKEQKVTYTILPFEVTELVGAENGNIQGEEGLQTLTLKYSHDVASINKTSGAAFIFDKAGNAVYQAMASKSDQVVLNEDGTVTLNFVKVTTASEETTSAKAAIDWDIEDADYTLYLPAKFATSASGLTSAKTQVPLHVYVAPGVIVSYGSNSDARFEQQTQMSGVASAALTCEDGNTLTVAADKGKYWSHPIVGDWTNQAAVDEMNTALGSKVTTADFAAGSPVTVSMAGAQGNHSTLTFDFAGQEAGQKATIYTSVSFLETKAPLDNITVTGLDNVQISYAVGNGDGFVTEPTFSADACGITLVKVVGNLTGAKKVVISSKSSYTDPDATDPSAAVFTPKVGYQIAGYAMEDDYTLVNSWTAHASDDYPSNWEWSNDIVMSGYDCTIEQYSNGTYYVRNWSGVEGYDFSFVPNQYGIDYINGSDSWAGMYTGRDDYYYANHYGPYDYVYGLGEEAGYVILYGWYYKDYEDEGTWGATYLSWGDYIVDAINGINASEEDGTPAYNLAGQRVKANTKGIVIKNGRKYLQK